jgi:hypothetical protein
MSRSYIVVLTNGWQVLSDDPTFLDDLCNGEPTLTVRTNNRTYHVNRDRVVCIQEVRQ